MKVRCPDQCLILTGLHLEILLAGYFNKVFLLKFDTGMQAAVRIPCPIGGNLE